ncbi:hypothetical protein J7I94_35705 [Streptomyces sp. ISL-12]|uniref:hypothetical protein n=1 Tax=Streptomyces sp. ISL-12 TaxID=2819177 RepID=UPI001BEC3DDE|nr:hypothetical protein [Streptomyces sp. ISL-12]MBT2415811.1 hypothetical protein [Streptomyces sp. ISL-12]
MATTPGVPRRHIVHAANASLLAAALALPAGLTISSADAQSANGDRAGAVAQTTDPPQPPPSEPSGPAEGETPPPPPPDSDPAGPTDTTTSPPSTPSGTPDTTEPPDPGDTDGQASEPPPEQEEEIDEATTALNEEKERVPEELVSTVETLITLVGTVEDPRTKPQDRQGVVESAKNLSTALAAISNPRTPPELRKDLTTTVEQVTSALEKVSEPRVPTEKRSTLILVVKRATSTLDMICDPRTPRGLQGQMVTTMKNTAYVVERSNGPEATPALVPVGSSQDIMHAPRTPSREREQLSDITQQVSSLLRKISDPGTSQEERSEAAKELDEKTARMKKQQERAASAQERPKESLGKAAAFCSSAVFESMPESDLVQGLKKLVPAQWEEEGVKDFWKAEEKSNDTLDVLAQLRNNEHTHGPFKVVPLITELAELVPHDRLFGTLGAAALSCEQTATYLEEEFGVTVGSWLTKGGE